MDPFLSSVHDTQHSTINRDEPNLFAGVDHIGSVFTKYYAPSNYKNISFGWNVEKSLTQLKGATSRSNAASSETKRAILKFFGDLRDIHSRPSFISDRAVWLGLHIKKTKNGYLIAWIDRSILPKGKVNLDVGDEVLTFDGKSISSAVENVRQETQWFSTEDFEQSFAEWLLTYRAQSEWIELPPVNDTIKLEVLRSNRKIPEAVTLKWLDDEKYPPSSRCPFWGKTKLGYLPKLGEILWASPEASEYRSYVFRHSGKNYGYVRFHTFRLDKDARIKALNDLDSAVSKFKKYKIQNLVIDQLGNGGGNFVFGFSLLSRITTQPLRTPLQNYLLSRNELVGFGKIEFIQKEINYLSKLASNQEASAYLAQHPIFSSNLNFVNKDLKAIENFRNFLSLFVKDASQTSDLHLSPPHYQFQEWIQSSEGPQYSGPITLLIDELNISAAEYIAAVLKDNKRAKLLGVNTAGAGGDQRSISIHSICSANNEGWEFEHCIDQSTAMSLKRLGLQGFSYTITLGQRVGMRGELLGEIENKGIAPDYEYRITKSDLTSNFIGYRTFILKHLVIR